MQNGIFCWTDSCVDEGVLWRVIGHSLPVLGVEGGLFFFSLLSEQTFYVQGVTLPAPYFHLCREALSWPWCREQNPGRPGTGPRAWEQPSVFLNHANRFLLSEKGRSIKRRGWMSFYGRTKEFRFFHLEFSLAIVWKRRLNESLFN